MQTTAMIHPTRSTPAFSTLKWLVYSLSVIILALGLILGISLLSSSAGLQNVLPPLQMIGGGEVIANLISPYLRGLLSGLGLVILAISLALSLLLFAVGRLLGSNAGLEARLVRLEASVLEAS